MKKYLLLGVALLGLVGCAEPENPEVTAAKQEIQELKDSMIEYNEYLGTLQEVHTILARELDPNSETIVSIQESMEHCAGKDTYDCIQLRESVSNFKKAVKEQVEEMVSMAKFHSMEW